MLGTNQRTCDSCRDPQVVTIIGPRETYSGPLSHGALRQPRPARLHLLAFLQCSQQGRRSHNHCGDDHLSSRPHLPRSYTTSITLAVVSSPVVTASRYTTIIARLRRVKPNLTKQHSTDGRPVLSLSAARRTSCVDDDQEHATVADDDQDVVFIRHSRYVIVIDGDSDDVVMDDHHNAGSSVNFQLHPEEILFSHRSHRGAGWRCYLPLITPTRSDARVAAAAFPASQTYGANIRRLYFVGGRRALQDQRTVLVSCVSHRHRVPRRGAPQEPVPVQVLHKPTYKGTASASRSWRLSDIFRTTSAPRSFGTCARRIRAVSTRSSGSR